MSSLYLHKVNRNDQFADFISMKFKDFYFLMNKSDKSTAFMIH